MFFQSRPLMIALLAVSMFAGCAAQNETDPSGPVAESDVTALDDNALQGKLRGILSGVEFSSEADMPYVVFEGDVASGAKLSSKVVRKALQAAVKENSDTHRDILPTKVRSTRLNVSSTIGDGDGADAERHDRQLSIALKVMRSNLKSVVGFTFGTNESGDSDEEGNVLYIYVGISKKSGKLIAIMTEAVYT